LNQESDLNGEIGGQNEAVGQGFELKKPTDGPTNANIFIVIEHKYIDRC
jgi:hypothetical protein